MVGRALDSFHLKDDSRGNSPLRLEWQVEMEGVRGQGWILDHRVVSCFYVRLDGIPADCGAGRVWLGDFRGEAIDDLRGVPSIVFFIAFFLNWLLTALQRRRRRAFAAHSARVLARPVPPCFFFLSCVLSEFPVPVKFVPPPFQIHFTQHPP